MNGAALTRELSRGLPVSLTRLIRSSTGQNVRFKISPSFDTTKLEKGGFLDRVDVYEDRIRGWLIEPARILNCHEHAGFAVLHLVLSYVEGAEIFVRGESSRGRENEFFRAGLLDLFPEIRRLPPNQQSDLGDIFWADARCGLFHQGLVRPRVVLMDGTPRLQCSISEDGSTITRVALDRYGIVDAVDAHLASFVPKLRDPKADEVHKRFEAAWRIVHV